MSLPTSWSEQIVVKYNQYGQYWWNGVNKPLESNAEFTIDELLGNKIRRGDIIEFYVEDVESLEKGVLSTTTEAISLPPEVTKILYDDYMSRYRPVIHIDEFHYQENKERLLNDIYKQLDYMGLLDLCSYVNVPTDPEKRITAYITEIEAVQYVDDYKYVLSIDPNEYLSKNFKRYTYAYSKFKGTLVPVREDYPVIGSTRLQNEIINLNKNGYLYLITVECVFGKISGKVSVMSTTYEPLSNHALSEKLAQEIWDDVSSPFLKQYGFNVP